MIGPEFSVISPNSNSPKTHCNQGGIVADAELARGPLWLPDQVLARFSDRRADATITLAHPNGDDDGARKRKPGPTRQCQQKGLRDERHGNQPGRQAPAEACVRRRFPPACSKGDKSHQHHAADQRENNGGKAESRTRGKKHGPIRPQQPPIEPPKHAKQQTGQRQRQEPQQPPLIAAQRVGERHEDAQLRPGGASREARGKIGPWIIGEAALPTT